MARRRTTSRRRPGAVRAGLLLATVNHLQLGWAPSAMAQVESWLR